MSRRRRAGGVLVLVVLGLVVPVLAVLGAAAPARAATVTGCTGALGTNDVRFTWIGGSGSWTDPSHWQRTGANVGHDVPTYYGAVPGTDDSARGFVCVQPSSHATITLDSSAHVHVQALEVANATLDATGARIMVYGPAASRTSTIHDTATLILRESTLGGPGEIDLDGTVVWGESGTGAATLDNDYCADFPVGQQVAACAGIATTGVLRVRDGGSLEVHGRGVNLSDGYRLEAASGGRIRVDGGTGYVAADRDTAISVEAGGTLELKGDGSVFEGMANARPDGELAHLTNAGTVTKSAGSGRSSLNVRYDGTGRIEVLSGGLSVAGGAAVGATGTVVGGARLGTGSCGTAGAAGDASRPCDPATSADDPLYAVYRPDRTAAGVAVVEGTTTDAASGDLQPAVDVTAPVSPGSLSFAFHDDALPAVPQLALFRRRPGLASERIPLCRRGGAIPAKVTACVTGRFVVSDEVRFRVNAADPGGRWTLRPSGVDFVRLVDPLVGSRSGCLVMHPSYPNVSTQPVRMARAGRLRVWFSTVENTQATGTLVHDRTAQAGINQVPIRFSRNGWVAAQARGADGTDESSGAFRVVATPTVTFAQRSKAALAGRRLLLAGRVVPGGKRVVDLYAVRVAGRSGLLRRANVRVRTDRKGRFTVAYKPPRAGRYVLAVQVQGKDGLTTAMSRRAVRVRVKAPPPRPPAPAVVRDVRPAEQTTTAPTGPTVDPLDVLGAFYPGRAATCAFQVRY
ncbi:hypothetical protein [Pimelobacter simplex]|uniref:hypothetical protein n=2 Tax=Nocardioides simplex TaxID=2045 RepID=UPI0008E36BE9|nr:hypothetical protein [Pimelobacter simplex]SFN01130.1 hypothetical protein SAMN05421671_4605 [Pimelobacter simplex]